jgi:alkylation response protein AidB-like acyl-CoA dehydrogenase
MDDFLIASDEQAMLRDSVRRWVAQFDPRRQEESPAALFRQFDEFGWLAAGLPETVGGLGGSVHDAAIIAEELGRGLVRAGFVEVAVTAAQLLLRIAPDELPALIAGHTRPVLAHEEWEARGDPRWVGTRAVREAGAWRLSGRKTAILGAPLADLLLVSARVDGAGVTLFKLPAERAALKEFTSMDDRRCAELLLDRTEAEPLGPVGGALPALLQALDHALVLEGAEALGAMERALEITCDYLQNRRQYGQRLADFQALRHRLADMRIEIEQARSILLRALEALRTDEGERSLYAAAAKARIAQSGLFVGAQAIQLHGGIGVTEEYTIGHYFKRLVAFNQRRGSADVHVERFAAMRRHEAEAARGGAHTTTPR